MPRHVHVRQGFHPSRYIEAARLSNQHRLDFKLERRGGMQHKNKVATQQRNGAQTLCKATGQHSIALQCGYAFALVIAVSLPVR